MAKRRLKRCPCGSERTYAECCRPFHRGAEPARPGELVRARFAAFALGDGEFLFRTLHPEHALRARPERRVVCELGAAHRALRYRDVELREDATEGEVGQALFEAHVFEKGRDRSFVELSRFERHDGGWRYLDGITVPSEHDAARARTIEAFLEAL